MWLSTATVALAVLAGSVHSVALGQDERPEFPKFADVSKDYTKVISTADDQSLYTLWVREKDGQILAELPRGFANQRHFMAMTVAGGDDWAGLQGGDVYFYWKRFDKSMAMVEPNILTRSSGDKESRAGVDNQYTDRVLLDVPIVCMGPSGQPVIDLDSLLAGGAGNFFGRQASGANPRLARVKSIKAFPKNIEISMEMPVQGGLLKTFHYSISLIESDPSYKPREADERVGFFTTWYRDLGKFRDDKKWVRYVNRWNLEKRDPSLKMSPPKEPIVFYVDATTPVRYRRWIKQGILEWNKAFEKIGITDAIEVYYQDAATGAHMEKDPEDVRYNFIRWLSNDQSTAVGPSRTNPMTGQILDADIVLSDGWIRYYWFQYESLLPEMAMEGMSPKTVAWLDRHPQWDPRVRMADPSQQPSLIAERLARGPQASAFADAADHEQHKLYGDDAFDGIRGQQSQFNGMCMASHGKGMDIAVARMHMEMAGLMAEQGLLEGPGGPGSPAAPGEPGKGEEPKKDDSDKLDGIPEWFIGPMLSDLVSHEVGHTLGLRHNFKASSLYKLADINSEEFKGKKPFTGSVMDYTPSNFNFESGPIQGDYTVSGIGPYDYWAIEYGYTFGDPKEVVKRVANPELAYLTDEDVGGPDPTAQRYDFTADPLDFAMNQQRAVDFYRARLLDGYVKDGDSWSKARLGYQITLGLQMRSISMMAPWIGGDFVHRDRKGDPDGRAPIEVVPVEQQRAALKFIVDYAFRDEAFGLKPEMLKYMTVDKWFDEGGMSGIRADSTFPVHDRIMGIQASALSLVLNPTTLQRVYDNEFRVPADEDMITLPEVFDTLTSAIWGELDAAPTRQYTSREPMVSSLRRNLQREYLERLIDLAGPDALPGAAAKPVSNLALTTLRNLRQKIKDVTEGKAHDKVDAYTLAHLSEAGVRIDQVLSAEYIYNTNEISSGGGGFYPFMGGQGAGQTSYGQPAQPQWDPYATPANDRTFVPHRDDTAE